MKTLLKNGFIYDGTGGEAFSGDILIQDEMLEEIGENLTDDEAEVIDLAGRSVSPGFFDAHSHNDFFAIKKEPEKYFEPFVRQGITSFIAGNCGLSSVGFEKDSPYKEGIGGGLFHNWDVTGEYGTVKEFFDAIDKNTPLNIATLVGHCSARNSVSGFENRELTPEERSRMLGIMEQGLKEGACGLSLGLMYEPGVYAKTEELRDVAKLCETYDVPMTVHPRASSAVSLAYSSPFGRPHILRALDELEEVSRGTHMKLQYSHAIFVGRSSFKCKDELLAILMRIRENGIDAMFDIYAEDRGVSVITVIMPAWYQSMSKEEKRKPFNKLKFTLLAKLSMKMLGFNFENILIADVGEGYEKYEGKTVHQIAQEEGMSDIDAYLHLCEISNNTGRVIMEPYSTAEIISEFSKHPNVLYMTDAWVEERGVQNLAIYDCFPKFLHLSLKGSGDTMPATIRKMSGAVADRFCIGQRGYIKKGFFADLTVFDEEKLKNGVPDQNKPFGIEKVFVNGIKVLDGDVLDRQAFAKAGRAMPRER